MITLSQTTDRLRIPPLLSQRKLNLLSLAILFAVSILQIRNASKEVSSLDNGYNGNSIAKKGISNPPPHLYSLQNYSMVDNNTHPMYIWIGNRWVPPMGVPYLLPEQIRHIFRSENTLWLGDSTARQDYQTMYQLIQGDSATKGYLNKLINKGKKGTPPMHCPARRQKAFVKDAGQVKGTDQNCFSNSTTMDTNETDIDKSWSSKAGKFDLGVYAGCYDRLLDNLKNYTELLQPEYSVLVISGGIWESVRPWDCRRANETDEGVSSHALDLLDFLFQEVSGPSLFVIWKTHGPQADDQRNAKMEAIDQSIVTAARSWFAEQQPPYMDLADFNLEIEERAHGSDRINGDLRPHWGLEARLLSIEMVSDIIRRKQERENA